MRLCFPSILCAIHTVVFASITIFHGLHWNYQKLPFHTYKIFAYFYFIHFSASWVLCSNGMVVAFFRVCVCVCAKSVRLCVLYSFSPQRDFPKWNKQRKKERALTQTNTKAHPHTRTLIVRHRSGSVSVTGNKFQIKSRNGNEDEKLELRM